MSYRQQLDSKIKLADDIFNQQSKQPEELQKFQLDLLKPHQNLLTISTAKMFNYLTHSNTRLCYITHIRQNEILHRALLIPLERAKMQFLSTPDLINQLKKCFDIQAEYQSANFIQKVAAKCSFLVEKIAKIVPSMKSEFKAKDVSKEDIPQLLREEALKDPFSCQPKENTDKYFQISLSDQILRKPITLHQPTQLDGQIGIYE